MTHRVVPGAEPFAFEGGPTGLLLLHGFTGNPASVRPWGEWAAARGHTVMGPRLPGHGTTWQDLAQRTWREWVGEAERALGDLVARCETVVVCGQSAGGAIALHLGATRSEVLRGIVAVNPYLRDRRHALVRLGRLFLRTVPGVGNDIKKPGADEVSYERIPLAAVAQLAQLLKIVRGELPEMRLPLRLFHSREDHVVPKGTAQWVMETVGSEDKELLVLDDSYHVATLDNDADSIFESTDEFVRALHG